MATVIIGREQPTSPKALALLVIPNGYYAGRVLTLNHGVTKIGHGGSDNHHELDDRAVSAAHLSIRSQEAEFLLTDLDSLNGTEVNGARIDHTHMLKDKDCIRIGETDLIFLRFDLAEAAANVTSQS